MPDLLQLAEAVVVARQTLAAAEAAFRLAEGRPKALNGKPRPVVLAALVGALPVSQRVRDLLKDSKKPLTFGEIVQLMGGRGTEMAVRSALKKSRERGDVQFKGGLYGWKGK